MRAPLKRYYVKSILPFLLFIGLIIGTSVLEPSLPSLAAKAGYFRYLGECDELERKIEMDAMAVSSMTGVLAGYTLLLLHRFQVLELNTRDILTLLVLIICLAYMITRYIGIWRFRA